MPLVSNIYSFVTTFISSLILPTKDKGIGGFIFGRFFQNLWDWICTGFYYICRWFLAFMDFLQYFIQKLIGLDYWLDSAIDGRRNLSEAATEDTIFKFLYADSVQRVFRALCALFVILLIIFTIFQIIKSEWDFMTGDGGPKSSNSKAVIFKSAIKAIVLVIAFPVLLVLGIISSNAILASIIKAVGVDMAETFGGKIFAISAQPANKYRHYVDADAYRPVTDQVTFYLDENDDMIMFGDDAGGNDRIYYSNYLEYFRKTQTVRKFTFNSIFDPLVPKHEDDFSGFCFRVDDENGDFEYYFIKADSGNKDDVYFYLTRCLGARVLNKHSSWASDETGALLKEGIDSNFNSTKNDGCYITGLNIQKGSDTVRTICRNSWNYSLVYITPNKKLTQTISSLGNQPLNEYNLGSANEFGSILYNSSHISGYFDGGQFGVVQSRAEYSVMADVIDFMCDNNLTFYIMDATSPLIDWNYHYDKNGDGTVANDEAYVIDNKWISSNVTGIGITSINEVFLNETQHATLLYDDTDDARDVRALTFLTKYSNNYALPAESDQEVIYTASFTAGSELEGSRYIICMKGDQNYYPLVNGKEISIDGKEYTFSSNQYASEYHGVVWAKGTFDTKTVDAVYGNPTYLKNTSTFDNGKLKTKADADGSYYYDLDLSDYDALNKTGAGKIKLYNYYTQNIDGTKYAYNSGSIYIEGDTTFSSTTPGSDVIELAKTNGVGGFDCTYKLKKTGKTVENDAGTEFDEYASADSGICYVLYYNGSTYAELQENGTLGSYDSKLSPYFLSKSRAKLAADLAVKTYDVPNINMNESDGASVLKNSFSIFSDNEYIGTFTKKGLIEVADLTEVSSKTKVFKANWGGTYNNLKIQGTVTKETTGGVQGKYNSTLEVDDAKLATMLITFETTQASDSVTCYRNHIENFSGNSFGSVLIEINIALFKAIVDIKTGMVQQVADTPYGSETFSYAGANSGITFDYFFDQNISVKTFYAPSKINYFVLLVSSVLIIKVLFSALWGVIKRFYMITLYYLAMPIAASTMPIDSGSRFTNIRNEITGEVLSTYGVLIGLNVFFVLLAPIKEISHSIFTDEMIANSGSYFLQKLPISAKMLNEFIYILFLLVAFTLINELPTVIQTMVGKGKSVDATGNAVRGNVQKTMESARKMISGEELKGSIKNMAASAPGFIPGAAFIGGAVKKMGAGFKNFSQNFRQGYSQTFGSNSSNSNSNSNSQSQGNNREVEYDEDGNIIQPEGEAENERMFEDGAEGMENMVENALENPLDGAPMGGESALDNPLDGAPLGGEAGEAFEEAMEDVAGMAIPLARRPEDKNGLRPFGNGEVGGRGLGENARESDGQGGFGTDEARIREIVRDELGRGGRPGMGGSRAVSAENARDMGATDANDPRTVAGSTKNIKATQEEIDARNSLKGHRLDLLSTTKDIMLARATLINPMASDQDKLAAQLKLNEANDKKDKIKEHIAKDKQTIEDNMTPERKAARRRQITNTVMSSVGAAATVAATAFGGPLAGVLVHKTAKNLKKAAPALIDKATKTYGVLKGQVKEFKAADGWARAEMLSGMAMKGAGIGAMGALVAPAIKFAAPALKAVNKAAGDLGIPLWAIGTAALSGKLAQKVTGAAASGNSYVNRRPGRGVYVPAGAGTDVPQQAQSAENARETGDPRTVAGSTKNIKATQEEIDARNSLKGHRLDLLSTTKDIMLARATLINPMASEQDKLAAQLKLNEANDKKDKIKEHIAKDKQTIEDNMTPERKAARRRQITNTVMSSVGAAATVAATAFGGPLAGVLVHKTAKNLKKAAPALIDKATKTYGVLKGQVKEFKAADGWGRAEMLSGMAMKGAGLVAGGILAGKVALPVIKFAAPALKAVNKAAGDLGIPLWAIGTAALSGKLAQKVTGAAASGNSYVNRRPGRVGYVPVGAGTDVPQQAQSAENAREMGAADASAPGTAVGKVQNVKATQEEIDARKSLNGHRLGLLTATKDIAAARAVMMNPFAKKEEKDAARQKLDDAKEKRDELKKEITADKVAIDKSMSPERKAARRQQITNTVMSSVGAAATVAATAFGGPLAGVLIHKTAKNLKKTAPGIVHAIANKHGEFKSADGWRKAEILSNLAMKGAGIGAIGALVAPAVKFAMPAIKAVNSATRELGIPLWAVGAAGLSGVVSKKLSARMSSNASFVNQGHNRVVQTGTGVDIPEQPAGGANFVSNARTGGPVKMPAMTKAEADARKAFSAKKEEYDNAVNESKSAQKLVKDKTKEKKDIERKIKRNDKELKSIQLDESFRDMPEGEERFKKEAEYNKKLARKQKLEAENKALEAKKEKAGPTDVDKANAENAKADKKRLKEEKTAAKSAVEKSMSPERKAARRERITNVIMNSVGTAGTIAATAMGGPLMGILVHKTAKNLKKAAPAVVHKVANTVGELKGQVGQFKAADGWGKAEMLSSMAMKGAGLAAGGYLAAKAAIPIANFISPAIQFAAPALKTIKDITADYKAPLWALGAVGLTSAIGRRVSGGGSYINSNRRFVSAGTGISIPNETFEGQTSAREAEFSSSASRSVTRHQTVYDTQNSFVYDESRIAEIVRRVLRGEDVLRSRSDKMEAAAHFANYGAMLDKSFVSNRNDAYRNAIVNNIGTQGGRVVVGDAINNHAANAGVDVSAMLLDGYTGADGSQKAGLLSTNSKVALYRSMMTSEQKDTLDQMAAQNKDFDSLGFIQDKMNMKLGASYSEGKGIEFNVNGKTVQGKGAKNEAVNGALKEVMDSGEISSKAVVDSIERTDYMKNTEKAIADNYALTIDYSKEKSGKVSGSDYHQVVFDKASKDEDINAEAMYEHIKKDTTPGGKLETFNSEYHITKDTPMSDIIDSVKSGIRNKNALFAQVKPEDYAEELSSTVAKHVSDGSFKVQAFDMLSKKDQLGLADNISANLNAASTGATFAYTDEEKAVKQSISSKKIGNEEFTNAVLNHQSDEVNQVVDNFIGQQAKILDSDNNYNPDAENSKRIMNEINSDSSLKAKKEKLTSESFTEGDIALGYAKAETVGDKANYDSYVGNHASDRKVMETMMAKESAETKSKEETAKAAKIEKQSFNEYQSIARKEYEAKAATKLDDSILTEENKNKVLENGNKVSEAIRHIGELKRNNADPKEIEDAERKLADQQKEYNKQKDEYNDAMLRRKTYEARQGSTDKAFDKLDMSSNQTYLDNELAIAEKFKTAINDDSLVFGKRVGRFSVDKETNTGNIDHNIFRDKIFEKAGIDWLSMDKDDASGESFKKISGALDNYISELQKAKNTRKEATVQATAPLTNSEFVEAAMGDTTQKEGEVANRLTLDSVGLKHSNGTIDTTSSVYNQFLDEMTSDGNQHWGEKLVALESLDGSEAQDLVRGYAKAKILSEQSDSKRMASFIGANANSRNKEVVDKIVGASQVDPSKELEEKFQEIELYGNLSDKDVRNYATATSKQKKMHEEVKAAFGYVKGGDAATNAAAEKAMAKYISSNGQNQDLVNMQGVNVNQTLLASVNDKYFTTRGANGATLAEDITAGAELMKSSEDRSKIEKLFEMQNNGKSKAQLEREAYALMESADKEAETATPGQFSNANARAAVNNLRAEYLIGDRAISELKTDKQTQYKPAFSESFAKFAKQSLPSEQVEAISRNAAENGLSILSIAQRNAYTAGYAQRDPGARAVLHENNVDLTSLMQISQFLNSPFGEALKERLIAKISQELSALDIFAHRLGVSEAGVYNLVRKQTSNKQEAAVYEKAQGNLISMETVKERASNEPSNAADSIAKNASARIQVLSKDEKERAEVEGIYNYILASDNFEYKKSVLASKNVQDVISQSGEFAGKKEVIKLLSEKSEANKREIEIGAISSKLSSYQAANEKAIAGGGLERQRKVADTIWNDDDTRSLARARYRKDNRGAELENLNEVDRNNYLFGNYDRFLSSESDARKKVDDIMKNSKVDFENKATSNDIIKSMNQEEFNTVTKGMKEDGETAVSEIKQSIIEEKVASNSLTEIPDENKKTPEEIKEFHSAKSQLEQDYRKNNFDERFAELYRNTDLVVDTLKELLSSGNPNISDIDLMKLKEEALRKNGSFMGGTMDAVLSSAGYEAIFEKVKSYLKANGNIDYDQLSADEKGKAINELLANGEFLKSSGIDDKQFRKDIESEFAKRSATATNTDIKMGIPSQQILDFLRTAQGEGIRDQLMRIGAHNPSLMYRKERYNDARMRYGLNHHLMRRIMVRSVLRQLYREPELKRMIAQDQSLYSSELKRLSKNEARKYINEHFEELVQRLGERLLLNKDKRGNYTLKQTVNKTVVNKTFNNLEKNDSVFAAKVKEMINAITGKSSDNRSSDSGADLEDLYRRLVGKFENSAEFKGIVERITKPTMQNQLDSFFNKGETQNRILETTRERLLVDTDFSRRIYESANANTKRKIQQLESDLDKLSARLRGLKK